MTLLPHQQRALTGLKFLFGLLLLGLVIWIVALGCGCQPKREVLAVHHESSDIAAAIASNLEARDVGGKSYVVSPTGSMEPTLHGGDYIVALKTDFADLRVGMIVNYFPEWEPNLLVCHRLVATWPDGGFLAEGDGPRNTAETKSRVTTDNYVSRVISVYRVP